MVAPTEPLCSSQDHTGSFVIKFFITVATEYYQLGVLCACYQKKLNLLQI